MEYSTIDTEIGKEFSHLSGSRGRGVLNSLSAETQGPPFSTSGQLRRETTSESSLDEELTMQLALASEMDGDKNNTKQELAERLRALADVTKRLQFEHGLLKMEAKPNPSILRLYRVWCPETESTTITTDIPLYSRDSMEDDHRHLQGYLVVSNLDVYLERQESAPFLVFRDYECGLSQKRLSAAGKANDKAELSAGSSLLQETTRILSQDLCDTMSKIADKHQDAKEIFPIFDTATEILAPYLFYYQNRAFFQTIKENLQKDSEEYLLLQHIHNSMEEEYQEVDALFDEGLVTAKFIPYLFAPKTTLVTNKIGETKAFRQKTQLCRSDPYETDHTKLSWSTIGETWVYDGIFTKRESSLSVKYVDPKQPKMEIQKLAVYPIRFAEIGTEDALRNRGKKFWSCRKPNYVTYSGRDYTREQVYVSTMECCLEIMDADNLYLKSGVRFMIDINAYQTMHKHRLGKKEEENALSSEAMDNDQPPDGDFALILPSNIYGFHMQDKKWGSRSKKAAILHVTGLTIF